MRKPMEILWLPGPGRPVRRWLLTRARAWGIAAAWVLLSVTFAAAGFASAHLLLQAAPW